MEGGAATTAALIGEALSHGDMGIAYAALAPGAVKLGGTAVAAITVVTDSLIIVTPSATAG